VQTASASKVSPGFYRRLVASPAVEELGQKLQVVEVSIDETPTLVQAMGLGPEPGFYFVRRNGKRLELATRLIGSKGADESVQWIRTQLDQATKADPALAKSGLFHRDSMAAATPQAEAPPQGWIPPAPAQFTYQAAPPVVSAPVVVQSPAPSIVLQQQAPQIFLAPPTSPPTVNILSAAPASAPQILMGQAQPAPQTVCAPAQQPLTMVAAPCAAPVAAAPLVAIPPSLFGRMVGNLGEKLMKHKYPRIAGGVVTTQLAQPALTPVAVAQPQVVSMPVAPAATPSPQAEPGRHGLLEFLKH
jgi:hypothetical protein